MMKRMGNRQPAEGLDISAFFGFLRRRGLVVALAIIVGALTGYVVSNSKEPTYEATANLLLRGVPSTQPQENFDPGVPESSADRENVVLADAVLARAVRRLEPQLGEDRAEAAVAGVGAFSGQESEAVEISATASNPRVAARVANAVASAAISERRAKALSRIARAEVAAQRQVDNLAGAGPEATPAMQEAQKFLKQRSTDASR